MDLGEIFVWINEHAVRQDNEFGYNDFVLRAKRVIKHPKYGLNKYYHDIALIQLPKRLDLSRDGLSHVCLTSYNKLAGCPALTAGWGDTDRKSK